MDNKFRTVRGYQLLRQNTLMTSAMEDYLEMIYRMTRNEGHLRIQELADKLHVRASSATKMVQKLGGAGLIHYKKYGVIALSELGKEFGAYLLKRHAVIERFLTLLGIGENLLVETELIEHNISENTLRRLETLNAFLSSSPELVKRLKKYMERDDSL